MQKTAPWRRARKAALLKFADVKCPQCVDALAQPKHIASPNLITRNREAIAEELYRAGVPVGPGAGSHRRKG